MLLMERRPAETCNDPTGTGRFGHLNIGCLDAIAFWNERHRIEESLGNHQPGAGIPFALRLVLGVKVEDVHAVLIRA